MQPGALITNRCVVAPVTRANISEMTSIINWRTLSILVGLILILLLYSIRDLEVKSKKYQFPHLEPWNCTYATDAERMSNAKCQNNDTKVILFYTPWFGQKPWPDFASTGLNLSHANCPEKNCKITYNVHDIGKSDLIIFHASDMPRFVSRDELQQIHKYRCSSQRMAFLCHESVQNEPLDDFVIPDGFFNWTITFKTDSDFHFPYGSYVRLPPDENVPTLIDYAASKSKFVLWAVSHCGTIREKYVKKLLNYINVDIYGVCSYVYGQDNQCSKSSNCGDIFRPYKFTLAFENGVCTDYITEKFWAALNRNSVPVVLAKDYYRTDVVPPGSFISVQDFPSVKALAEYLLYLDKNNTAYNEYFSWKQKFDSKRINSFPACDVCAALHDECLKPKVYYDMFKKFWNEDVDCKNREQTLSRLIDKD